MTAPERLGFLATWNARLRTSEMLDYLQPGFATSYPMPCKTDTGLVIRHFYHASDMIGPDTISIEPPVMVLSFTYPDWEFIGAEQTNFGIKSAFETATVTFTPEQREARRPLIAQLEILYEQLLTNYPNPPSQLTAQQFLDTLKQIAPEALWAYYEVLAGEFVNWVNQK